MSTFAPGGGRSLMPLLDSPTARRVLAQLQRRRGRPPSETRHARFDPVKVEAEFYDAIYGARTGTVENVTPVREG